MKYTITSLLLLLFVGISVSQDLNYRVRGKYESPVTKETLIGAKSISDFRPGYPSTWIHDYVSTEITVKGNGKFLKANGMNEKLTAEQQLYLSMADVGNVIVVDVRYNYENSITGNNDPRHMHFEMTVIPEVEAEYPGGSQQLTMYLEKNAIDKISARFPKEMTQVIIRFTITETGEIANAQVSSSSKDPLIDKLLLNAINKMPAWKPAENSKGIKISQEFEFSVGDIGC